MSTYCNHYKKDDCKCYDKRYDDYDKKKKHDCRAILECGKEFFRSLPTSDFNALTNSDTPIPLAEVTIDTRKLSKPCVKIEYSSIINSVLTAGDPAPSLTLTFRLVRKCKGEDEEPLRTWTYERTTDTATSLTTGDSFTVTFCECFDRVCCDDKVGKCCTYTMQLVQAIFVGEVTPTYTINEKDISAMAACPSCVY